MPIDPENRPHFVARVTRFATLRGERDAARAEVEQRKHTLRFTDGAFYNITHLISVFMAFRQAIGPDAKCIWLITSPEENPLVGVNDIGSDRLALSERRP